jgi:hypothetical protein
VLLACLTGPASSRSPTTATPVNTQTKRTGWQQRPGRQKALIWLLVIIAIAVVAQVVWLIAQAI